MGYERVLDELESQDLLGRPGYDYQTFRCPAHDDTRASASLKEGDDGRALVYCHAGCETEDIVEALGLRMRDLFMEGRRVDAYYEYTDEDGIPLYRVVRFAPKGFTQERWTPEEQAYVPGLNGVRRVLYHLPEVLGATEVFIVEGEKDVERLRSEGVVATCNVGGANVWRQEWSESLRGKDVVIIPDRDAPGEKHARTIQAALDGVANRTRLAYSASGKDVSDHLDAGYSLSQLRDEPHAEDVFEPLDWETYEAPETEWLYHPYIPTRGRVLVFGKAGSLKSLWVMWIATRLARAGRKVAYFSLEMRPEQTVARLKKLQPPRDRFKVFTSYRMGDKEYLRRTVQALEGYDLIVVDSWNAAYRFTGGGTHDDQVAELDDNFFQPIIDGTGATLVIIDNTGHDVASSFGVPRPMDHARGSSAKGDKMDVTIFLSRPDEGNNYLTEVSVKKMRYDIPIPSKRLVVAPSDHDGIEFFKADVLGAPGESAWDVEDEVINDVSNDRAIDRVENDVLQGPGGIRRGEMGEGSRSPEEAGSLQSKGSSEMGVPVDEMPNSEADREVAERAHEGRVLAQAEYRGVHEGMEQGSEAVLQTVGVVDADEQKPNAGDEFKGFTPAEKLAYLRAQRLFQEVNIEENSEGLA